MNNIEIRPASQQDKNTVLRFCQNTWDWGDYIEHVWDYWLCDKNGRLLVAVYDTIPVAVVHIGFISNEETWLEGMRIAPAYRKQRIGTNLTEYCLNLLKKAGARVVRFLTLSSNHAVHRMGIRYGFKHIASCRAFWSELESANSGKITKLETSHANRLWTFIETSETRKAHAGLYSTGWIYRELDRKQLEYHLSCGDVYGLRGSSPLDAFAIVSKSWLHNGPVIGYIDGKSISSIATLASELRHLNSAKGPIDRRIDINCAELKSTIEQFEAAGYHAYYNEPFFLYELVLHQYQPAPRTVSA